ncbi:hypothetical protein [Altererythrobacter sp. GH1-8]|uniref:hypothetical protein n=1 Tax=Altererythrobacter sp. GH1-8 TaxID=3349333 RepID=UPI00374D1672
MVRHQNRILPMEGRARIARNKRRFALWAGGLVCVALVIAYIDGGEEPLRPISQPVELPESRG